MSNHKPNNLHKPNNPKASNQQRVKRYLDLVALSSCVVMEGISSRAQWVLDHQEDLRKQPNAFINPDLYIDAAEAWFDMNPEYKKK